MNIKKIMVLIVLLFSSTILAGCDMFSQATTENVTTAVQTTTVQTTTVPTTTVPTTTNTTTVQTTTELVTTVDRNQEIGAIANALGSTGMVPNPTEFATELVDKGMTSSEFSDIMLAYTQFNSDLMNNQSAQEYYDSINTLLESTENIEAIVSALVKVSLTSMLEQEITEYRGYMLVYPESAEYYQETIDRDQAILDAIADNPDELVASITSTINYFISIEQLIPTDLLSYFDTLSQGGMLSPSEMVIVKDELVNVLTESMPTQEQVVTMFKVFDVLTNIAGVNVDYNSLVPNYDSKVADEALLSMQAFINFLDSLDLQFFTDITNNFSSTTLSYEMANTENSIILITYIDTFLHQNVALLDSINNVFTDSEKQILFNSIPNSSTDDKLNSIYGILSGLDFQTILSSQDTCGDVMLTFLDALVARDGELLRQLTIKNGFSYDYMGSSVNDVTGDIYLTDIDYDHAINLTEMKIAEEALYILNAGINTLNNSEYQMLIELVMNSIPADLIAVQDESMSIEFVNSVISIIKTALVDSSSDQLVLVQNFLNYMVDNNVLDDVQAMEEATYQYVKTTYPNATYYGDIVDDDYVDNAQIIEVAKIYSAFMDSTNRGFVDSIFADAIIAMYEDDIQTLTDLTDTEVTNLETNLPELLDFISANFTVFASYDASNLTSVQIAALDQFGLDLSSRMVLLTQAQIG